MKAAANGFTTHSTTASPHHASSSAAPAPAPSKPRAAAGQAQDQWPADEAQDEHEARWRSAPLGPRRRSGSPRRAPVTTGWRRADRSARARWRTRQASASGAAAAAIQPSHGLTGWLRRRARAKPSIVTNSGASSSAPTSSRTAHAGSTLRSVTTSRVALARGSRPSSSATMLRSAARPNASRRSGSTAARGRRRALARRRQQHGGQPGLDQRSLLAQRAREGEPRPLRGQARASPRPCPPPRARPPRPCAARRAARAARHPTSSPRTAAAADRPCRRAR